jgi:hypothetical protein
MSELIDDLKDRVASVERVFAAHEAICGERYNHWTEANKDLKEAMARSNTDVTASIDKLGKLVLLGFAIIALMTLLGPRAGLLDFLHGVVSK